MIEGARGERERIGQRKGRAIKDAEGKKKGGTV